MAIEPNKPIPLEKKRNMPAPRLLGASQAGLADLLQ
jgi:hypothetical protein